MMPRLLQNILKNDLCTGCGACSVVAGYEMRLTDRGFLEPRIHTEVSAEQDDKIWQICPGRSLSLEPQAPMHPLWGPILSSHTGYSTDEGLRHKGSSGAALSGLLVHLLERGVVDAVLHTGADPDAPKTNKTLVSTTRDQIFEAAGSRYAPSSPLTGLKAALAEHGKIAFVGKPCDAAAVANLRALDPDLGKRVPVIISFMCGGTPSQQGTDDILRDLGAEDEEITYFRYRGEGWPGGVRAETKSGNTYTMSYAESWGQYLSGKVHFRCKICPDGTGKFADIVFADAWYGDDKGYPSFEEADGRSMILVRTPTGDEALQAAVTSGAIATSPLDSNDIINMQPFQAKRMRLVKSRVAAIPLAARLAPRFTGLMTDEAATEAPLLARTRSFLGMLKRLWTGTA